MKEAEAVIAQLEIHSFQSQTHDFRIILLSVEVLVGWLFPVSQKFRKLPSEHEYMGQT